MRHRLLAVLLPWVLAGPAPASPLEVVSNLPADRYGLACSDSCTLAAGSAAALGGDRVLFVSRSPNLVDGDRNGAADLFVRQRSTGTTQLVSGLAGTTTLQAASFAGVLAAGGQHVAFLTSGNHLDPGDVNGSFDVYVRDLASGSFERASAAAPGGTEFAGASGTPALSADGRWVAFHSFSGLTPDDPTGFDIFVRDREAASLSRVSLGPPGVTAAGGTLLQSMSDDGRFVAMASAVASWRPAGDPAGQYWSVYVRDRAQSVTRAIANQVPTDFGVAAAPAIRAGKVLVQVGPTSTRPFAAPDACGIALVDATTLAATPVAVAGLPTAGATCWPLDLSSDAQAVLVSTSAALSPLDGNGAPDLYVVDAATGASSLASRGPGGAATGYESTVAAAFVPGSRDVVFSRRRAGEEGNDVYGVDSTFIAGSAGVDDVGLANPPARPTAVFAEGVVALAISDDGRFVLAWTEDPRLLRDTWDPVYARLVRIDRNDGSAVAVNRLPDGRFSAPHSARQSMSGDGRFVAFDTSPALGEPTQVYLRDLQAGTTTLVSGTLSGVPGNGRSSHPVISRDGRWIAYWTQATNLVGSPSPRPNWLVLADRVTRQQVAMATVDGEPDLLHFGVDREGRRLVLVTETPLLAGDIDGGVDVYVVERGSGAIRLLSSRDGMPDDTWGAYPAISPDGRYVAFESGNLLAGARKVLVDIDGGAVEPIALRSPFVSGELSGPHPPVLSEQARTIVYTPYLPNPLQRGGSTAEVVRYERATRIATFLSARADGAPTGGRSDEASMSADGRFVLFQTTVRGLADGDLNGRSRDFVLWDAASIQLFGDGFEAAAARF